MLDSPQFPTPNPTLWQLLDQGAKVFFPGGAAMGATPGDEFGLEGTVLKVRNQGGRVFILPLIPEAVAHAMEALDLLTIGLEQAQEIMTNPPAPRTIALSMN
jgi:hypothetical protein